MGLPLAGSTVQGRAFAWLLTCKVLSNKEWDDFRAARGQPPLGVLGVLDAKSPIAVRDTSWEGLCPQRRPQKSGPKTNNVTDESKASAAHPHNVTPFTDAKYQPPSQRSSRVWLSGPTQSLRCFPNAESWGSPKPSPSLWRQVLRVCISSCPPEARCPPAMFGDHLQKDCVRPLSVLGVRFLFSPSRTRSRALLGRQ